MTIVAKDLQLVTKNLIG